MDVVEPGDLLDNEKLVDLRVALDAANQQVVLVLEPPPAGSLYLLR